MNAYLWLTKYGGREHISPLFRAVEGNGENKRVLYDELLRRFRDYWRNDSLASGRAWYKHRFEQHYTDIPAENNCKRWLRLTAASPLLIGNGVTSALETHVTLHRTYGVPYIPGTAIKGIAAHFCHRVAGLQEERFQQGREVYDTLFGTTDGRGFITFHDAWPEPDSLADSLQLDVLTPHHQGYNQIRIDERRQVEFAANDYPAPRDDDSPDPIPFLSVRASFRLMLTCEGSDEASEQWLALACELTKRAIQSEGVGGKTSAGYGRFTVTEEGAAL